MTAQEKGVLNDIVNGLENLAVSMDALEAALIRRGQLTTGEIERLSPNHAPTVVAKLAGLRLAIASL
jgi:hypothetical protein